MLQLIHNTQTTTNSLQAVKERFFRIPSSNSYPRFVDIITGTEQADGGILLDYYRRNGGSQLSKEELVNSLLWMYGDTFKPGQGKVVGEYYNLWTAPALQFSGKDDDGSRPMPFLEFLERWFPDKEERTYFTWWMAHTVRRPEQRIIATPILRSEHGVGKGFFVETLMSGLLGRQSVAVTALKDVVADFNDVIEGKTFILIDEVYKQRMATTNALKSFQGNATLPLRRKHKPVVTIDNYINFIISSNDHLPLDIESGDRRFWVPAYIKHRHSQQDTSHFINAKLKPWLVKNDGEGFQAVRDYLERVPLDTFYASDAPPVTQGKQDMMGFASTDNLQDILSPYVENWSVLTLESIEAMIRDQSPKTSARSIASALLAMGCTQKRTNSTRYYITPNGISAGFDKKTSKHLQDACPKT